MKVLYFARLRETFGMAEEEIRGPATVTELLELLRNRGEAFARELDAGRSFRVAVNQEMVAMDSALQDSDEVAIFPPVTGG